MRNYSVALLVVFFLSGCSDQTVPPTTFTFYAENVEQLRSLSRYCQMNLRGTVNISGNKEAGWTVTCKY